MIKVLIIDDGIDITNYCHQFISNGFEYDHIKSGVNLKRELKKKDYNLILLDKSFTKNDKSELLGPVEDAENEGLRILTAIKKLDQNIPVIMVTAHADYDSMSSALHLGAFDYVEWDALQKDYLFLKLKMQRAIQWEKSARKELVEKYNQWGLIGKSQPMVKLFQQVETALNSDSTLLLQGETGTGKDLVAKIIHSHGKRYPEPFVSVNCATIPSTLLEEQLFGHEKGTFTDAKERRAGKFEIANGGTIFLNEIGELPKSLQAKLLKVIEEKKVDSIGGSKPIEVDVRIISATNRDIEEMVQKGEFRSDLYYRLKVLEIEVPSLKERMEDLPLLIDHFIYQKSELMEKEIAGITREASNYLHNRKWKGNVRELENLIEAAVKKADRLITLKDLLESHVSTEKPSFSPHEVCSKESPPEGCPVFKDADMNHIEKVAIINALKSNQGLIEPASKVLGISKATMYNKINQYGLSHLVKGYAER
ncbi:MAG: sigma-54-dependent transcriptional regulator [Candidatus Zixiibacteriota bacterium]